MGILEHETENCQQTPADSSDLYDSFIPGRSGRHHRTRLTPKGFKAADVTSIDRIVLKPDGEFFRKEYARIGEGTTKGDREAARVCVLRYLLAIFPEAEIRCSGGTDCSFHIILSVDETVSVLIRSAPDRFARLLQSLRIIAFCDKIDDDLLSALSARALDSQNSKTGITVTQVQPASGVYSHDALEEIVERWFSNPNTSTFGSWFGVGVGTTRCPYHDSADRDMKIGADDDSGIACFGGQHCAQGQKAKRIPIVSTKEMEPSLAGLLIENKTYLERWTAAFNAVNREYVELKTKVKMEEMSQRAGKMLITISDSTTDDEILAAVCGALSTLMNLYCDPAGTLLTLESNQATGALEIRRHDTVEKFISIVGRRANIAMKTGRTLRFSPLQHNWASTIFHRPELRAKLRVLSHVSKNPVLDIINKRVQPPGYDSTTKVFYDGPTIAVRDDGQTPHLDKSLSGWTGLCGSPFKSCKTDADAAHMYAGVFTEILADSRLFSIHRNLAVRANQKGAGKDKFAEVLGILRDGETPVDLNHNDENRINQGFGNGIHAGRRIFQVTNIDSSTTYENSMLTRWLTSESLTGPKHGGGNWTINPNTASVILTINKGAIDHDLLDRLLPVNLEIVGNAKKRRFDFSPNDYVLGHRLEIIGEVMGLAILCLKENREWKIPASMDRRFERWMKVIGALLERRGLPGFMENLEEVDDEIDEDKEAFVELSRRIYTAKPDTWLRPKDIVPFCRTGGGVGLAGKPLFAENLTGGSPERSLSKYVLMRFVNEVIRLPGTETEPGFAVALRRDVDAKNKSVVFKIEALARRGCGGDSSKNGEGVPASPPTKDAETVESTSVTTKSDGDGGDGKAQNASSPPVSPPHNILNSIGVVNVGGDNGDKTTGGSVGVITGDVLKPQNAATTIRNSSIAGPTESIPVIPALVAVAVEGTVTQDSSDPWEGGSL